MYGDHSIPAIRNKYDKMAIFSISDFALQIPNVANMLECNKQMLSECAGRRRSSLALLELVYNPNHSFVDVSTIEYNGT